MIKKLFLAASVLGLSALTLFSSLDLIPTKKSSAASFNPSVTYPTAATQNFATRLLQSGRSASLRIIPEYGNCTGESVSREWVTSGGVSFRVLIFLNINNEYMAKKGIKRYSTT